MYESKGNFMPNDENKFKTEVAYTILWEKYSFFHLEKIPKADSYKMLFISKYAPKVRHNIELDVKQQFCRDMVRFNRVFVEKSYAQQNDFVKKLEEEFENVNEMEKIFLELVSDFCVIHRKNENDVLVYAKKIAEYILGFVEAFYGGDFYKDENVHTAFLRDLCSNGMVKTGKVICTEK